MTTEVQTCYRHHDRRAGVRCQRCGRPICPACMHQASVGFHCPECVKQSGQRVMTPRNVVANESYMTKTLVALNLAVYVVSTLGRFGSPLTDPAPGFTTDWGTIGLGRIGLGLVGVAEGEAYRLITGGFLHVNLLHIGFNMFLLYVLGKQLEPALGRTKFAAVYMTSLLAGSLGVMIADPRTLSIGASGAVFGLLGYALVFQWSRGINPMDTGLGGLVLINLVFTFVASNISVGAHVGGLLGGIVAGLIIDFLAPRLKLPEVFATALVAVVGVGCFGLGIALASSLTLT